MELPNFWLPELSTFFRYELHFSFASLKFNCNMKKPKELQYQHVFTLRLGKNIN